MAEGRVRSGLGRGLPSLSAPSAKGAPLASPSFTRFIFSAYRKYIHLYPVTKGD